MSWLGKIIGSGAETEGVRLVRLRSTRFRHLLANYGRILDLLADAAEKQGGGYVFDQRYVVSLSETLFDLTESVVFDLNIMTDMRNAAFYDVLERLRTEAQELISSAAAERGPAPAPAPPTKRPSAQELSAAIARHEEIYKHKGQVASRGVASGPVFRLGGESNAGSFPPGGVLTAMEIRPDAELIRLMKQACAILTDFGGPASHMASVAREFRIPTIVGLADVSRALAPGEIVTVDADDNAVYRGRVQELLDYYASERLTTEEESEYRLLRGLRRAVFPLTLKKSGAPASMSDINTLHDLVHLAHELAGDVMAELLLTRRDLKRAAVDIDSEFHDARLIDMGNGLEPVTAPGEDLPRVRSAPWRSFWSGLRQGSAQVEAAPADAEALKLMSLITDDYAEIVMARPKGFDMAEARFGENRDMNYLYCRFDGAAPEGGARGTAAAEVLARLDFAAARTASAVTAWISGLPAAEMAERMAIVGRLAGWLARMDSGAWQNNGDAVKEFMRMHA
jgi:pyruvate,water dikinase